MRYQKQQLIDAKLVNLAQRCFKPSLIAHFLISIYEWVYRSLFYEGFYL